MPLEKHQDERRIIYDFNEAVFKSLKIVYVLDRIPIGDHYHSKKDEYFFLASGKFEEIVVNETILFNIDAPHFISIERETYHRFICSPGSILIGVATELFDSQDEIKRAIGVLL